MVWSPEESSKKDMSSKANVTHPERQRQAAWVPGPAAVPPGCMTTGKSHDFKNKLFLYGSGWLHLLSLENQASHWTAPGAKSSLSRDSHCVLKLVTLSPQYPHLRKATT